MSGRTFRPLKSASGSGRALAAGAAGAGSAAPPAGAAEAGAAGAGAALAGFVFCALAAPQRAMKAAKARKNLISAPERGKPSLCFVLPARAKEAANPAKLCQTAPRQAPENPFALWPQKAQAGDGPGAFLLCFREQIQRPQNASIARFDGLCCYQKSSETA